MQIVTGRRGEPHVTSRQMQAVYRSFLGDFALLDIGEKLRAEAYSNDIVRVYDGVVSVQGIYAVIAYNQYDEVYIEPVNVGKKRIDTIILHYTKDNALDVEDMQLDVVQGEEYTDNPIAPVVPEGGDAWEGTTDIQVPIYDVEVTNFGLTVTPHTRMLTVIPTLDSIAERIPETFVTGVKGDSEVSYRDGDVNITKANIGLENVDNTADTDKPISTATQTALNLKADLTYVDAKISAAYHAGGSKTVAELTSALLIADNIGKVYNMSDSGVTTSDFVEGAGKPINEGDNVGICNVGTEESPVYKFDLLSGFVDLSAYYTKTESDNKYVTKETGKGLSTEDYTTADKNKLAGIEAEANKTVVDSAMSDSSTNPLQNKVITKELEGAKTATGNPITVTDAAPVNAVNLSMDLEPIQDLHGYDHPWVGGAGKNKLPMTVDGIKSANTEGTWNGNVYTIYDVTYTLITDDDNNVIGIKVNGTSSATGSFARLYFHQAEIHNEYSGKILSGCPANNNVCYIRIEQRYSPYTVYAGDSGIEANISSNIENNECRTFIAVLSGKTANNLLFYPMIREATETDSSFAPYTNICPISGRSDVAIQSVSDNLINIPSSWDAYEISDGVYKGGFNNFRTKFYIPSTAVGKELTASVDLVSYGIYNARIVANVGGTNISGNGINSNESGTSTVTFTPQSTSDYVTLDYSSNLSDVELSNYLLVEYSKTYTIQLGQDVYGAQFDVTSGKMVVDKGYATITTLGRNAERSYWATISNAKPGFNIICNKQKTAINSFAIGVFVNDSGSFRINTEASYSSASECINAYGGSLDVCYELATPYTIQLTPQQIKLLENTNTLSSDGTMTLEYQPNNAIGEAVRAVEESYDPEFAVRPVLKKKAFSGTTDTDGSVTLINSSDIPSGHRIIPLQITDMTINGSAGTYFVEYKPYNSGDSVKAYCYTFFNGSRLTPVGSAVTGNFYYYELEV